MDREEFIEKIKKFAELHSLKLSSKKELLIEAVLKKEGYCPCRRVRTPETLCPCVYALEEITKNGKCMCGLFVKNGSGKNG